jgi:hypothetical protein
VESTRKSMIDVEHELRLTRQARLPDLSLIILAF